MIHMKRTEFMEISIRTPRLFFPDFCLFFMIFTQYVYIFYHPQEKIRDYDYLAYLLVTGLPILYIMIPSYEKLSFSGNSIRQKSYFFLRPPTEYKIPINELVHINLLRDNIRKGRSALSIVLKKEVFVAKQTLDYETHVLVGFIAEVCGRLKANSSTNALPFSIYDSGGIIGRSLHPAKPKK